jgi:serine/threonine protein kinase
MNEDVFGIVGSVIAGAYKVEAVVAEGGFGVVYRAYHSGFRAPVALKLLKIPQQLDKKHQAEFLEQFRAEAEVLFRLSASIATVVRPLHVDAVTTDSGVFVPFMALECLDGETLSLIHITEPTRQALISYAVF